MDKAVQTLCPIPVPKGEAFKNYNFTCRICSRYWILNATEGLMYSAYEKHGNSINKITLCFDCSNEKQQGNILRETAVTHWAAKEAWQYALVLITRFQCCHCGHNVDANYTLNDGHRGKIPFYKYIGQNNHKFCYLCFNKVQNLPLNDRYLNPALCPGDHSDEDPLDSIELHEEDLLK